MWDSAVPGFVYVQNRGNSSFSSSLGESVRFHSNYFIKRKKKQLDLFEEKPPRYFALACQKEGSAQEVLEWYRKRGQAENFIKELKQGFAIDRMPASFFSSCSVFFRIGILAYNIFIAQKYFVFPKEWMKHTVQTVRWKFYQTAGKCIFHAKQITLKVCTSVKKYQVFLRHRLQCYELLIADS